MSPDITKCGGGGCLLKDNCYRYTSKPSYLQSYFSNIPYKDGECDEYWPIDTDNQRVTK